MNRTEAVQRILSFASKKEGFDSAAVTAVLQLAVPPQVDAMFITAETAPSAEFVAFGGLSREADEPGPIFADVGLLSHDDWFVGITVYKRTIRSTEWRVGDVQAIEQGFVEIFWDVSFSLKAGFGEGYSLRARRDVWPDLNQFLELMRRKIRG